MAKKKGKAKETEKFSDDKEESAEEVKEEVKEEVIEEMQPEEPVEEQPKETEEKPEEEADEEPSKEEASEDDVEVVESKDDVETFKAQLVQALSLNDKLINEVKARDKEITVFKEIKENLDRVINEQKVNIEELNNEIQDLKTQKIRERSEEIAKLWIKRYGLGENDLPGVRNMLSKYTTEEELDEFERLIKNSRNEKSSPVPATQSSAVLVETFANNQVDYESLSPQQRRDLLFKQMEQQQTLEKNR